MISSSVHTDITISARYNLMFIEPDSENSPCTQASADILDDLRDRQVINRKHHERNLKFVSI